MIQRVQAPFRVSISKMMNCSKVAALGGGRNGD